MLGFAHYDVKWQISGLAVVEYLKKSPQNINEGNNQTFENKVSGRVSVGVEKALFSQ